VVIALSTVLRIKRTLNGAEIDELISDIQTRKAQAAERRRRKEWQRVVENAANFKPSRDIAARRAGHGSLKDPH
jgi:hypothetical protein